MSLHLEIADGRSRFRPGETLEGVAFWDLDAAPASVEVGLAWTTKGKGTEDSEAVETQRFDAPAARDRRAFRIRLPEGPYSFSGKLVSIVWTLVLMAEPSHRFFQTTLTLSPTGEEVVLYK